MNRSRQQDLNFSLVEIATQLSRRALCEQNVSTVVIELEPPTGLIQMKKIIRVQPAIVVGEDQEFSSRRFQPCVAGPGQPRAILAHRKDTQSGVAGFELCDNMA